MFLLLLGCCFIQDFLCITVGFLYSTFAVKLPAHLRTWPLCASPRRTQVKYSEYTSGRVLFPPCCEDIAVTLFSSIAAPCGESPLHTKHAWIADPVSLDNDILAFSCTKTLWGTWVSVSWPLAYLSVYGWIERRKKKSGNLSWTKWQTCKCISRLGFVMKNTESQVIYYSPSTE